MSIRIVRFGNLVRAEVSGRGAILFVTRRVHSKRRALRLAHRWVYSR